MPEPSRAEPSAIGDYLSRAAYLDAASSSAFERLSRELESHGAPACLVDECERARCVELCHAQRLGELAEHYGVTTATPPPAELSVRPLVAVALENVVEGVVRETYGAVVATVRGRSAGNAQVRKVMREIAHDEQAHARLAIDIATWFSLHMTDIENVWADNALRHASRALSREVDVEIAADLSWEVGVPSRCDALGICAGLSRRIWDTSQKRGSDKRGALLAA
jgi:hypothetical protein